MEIHIEYSTQPPTQKQFSELFETTGWNLDYKATPEELDRAVHNSQFVVAAYLDEQLIGFGRVVTDGVLHAMICDMIVHPFVKWRNLSCLQTKATMKAMIT